MNARDAVLARVDAPPPRVALDLTSVHWHRRTMLSRRASSLLVFAMLLVSTRASADATSDARVAQALFEEARILMDQKRFEEACPKLAESQRLDPGGGTLLNLAVCRAGEGKIATALVAYHEALAAATRDGRKDRETIARSSIEALERDVPRLTVSVPQPTPGMEVLLDTSVLPEPAWGVATPVDPGTHVVTVSAPGTSSTSVYVNVAVGERKVVEVPTGLPALAPFVPAPPAPPAPPALATTATTSSHEVTPSRPNPIFFVAAGVAVAGAVTAVVTGVMAASANSTAQDGCIEERNWCRDAESRDALESARSLAWISTGALISAGIGTIVALVTPSRRVGTRRSAIVGPGWYGLGGSF